MAVERKSLHSRKRQDGLSVTVPADPLDPDAAKIDRMRADGAACPPDGEGASGARAKRQRQGVVQFPMQILVPEETRAALRQRSEDTGASIRHIILRSLAADGFPVPRLPRRRD